MNEVRIGFIGVGDMGQAAHLRNYAITPGCRVVALAELRPKLAQQVAQKYGVERVYSDHRQMLEREKLDGLIVIQPFQFHGSILPELLGHNIPILIEKPLARSVETGEKLLASKGKLFVGYHKRCDPATIWAREKIAQWKQSGEFGPLKLLRITMPPGNWIAEGFFDLIRSDEPYPTLDPDPAPAGMNEAVARRYEAFVNYYIHQVNLARHLLGESYRITYADPSGVILAAQSASGVPFVLEMAPYRTTIDWHESALAAFEKGFIKFELPAPLALNCAGRVTVYEDSGRQQTTIPTLLTVHAMRQQADYFVAAIRGEATPLCGADEALQDLRLARDYIVLLGK
jgi:predicted dehydrogenase